ncbi:4Fe-4S dicluster domain-containing protein [Fundidesulfovibrio soli]|uniref:4Fe-4S dicluster domain-containing protein n=1 Tax=Fundidesulfovibrio soli TaxID=2922716 RepID=UPI001FAE9EF7|nr:4Fe-4S dicluster domain-containing protein [Fundidesulfovibrio soli]
MAILTAPIQALAAVWSMVVGLRVTVTNFFRPQETIHYPRQEVPPSHLDSFRGHIELVGADEDPAKARCIGCGLCAELCPSFCLKVVAEELPVDSAVCYPSQAGTDLLMPTPKFRAAPPSQTQPRKLLSYHLVYHTCSLCGLCVQNCPAGSLRFSHDVYLAGASRGRFEFDLMERLRGQAARGGAKGGKAHA